MKGLFQTACDESNLKYANNNKGGCQKKQCCPDGTNDYYRKCNGFKMSNYLEKFTGDVTTLTIADLMCKLSFKSFNNNKI